MSKAEDRAFERYPDYRAMDGGYVTQMKKRKVFTEGYQQAEKDNELTWEDMKHIYLLTLSVSDKQGWKGTDKSIYQEVLKRFKENT